VAAVGAVVEVDTALTTAAIFRTAVAAVVLRVDILEQIGRRSQIHRQVEELLRKQEIPTIPERLVMEALHQPALGMMEELLSAINFLTHKIL
jgi:hypothetical protein